ncbi:MAG: OmpA family protein [Verrucomicrobiales bacterium]|nr:OmpA family protein [Verrucomicrobiales bacterium]
MRFFFALLLFCGAVALFTFVAKAVYQGSVESELATLAGEALDEAGYEGVEVTFDHHVAKFSGFVDHQEDKAKVLELVQETVPIGVLPDEKGIRLEIRATIPPMVAVRKKQKDTEVLLEGVLGADGEAGRTLLGSRIHGVDGVESVNNQISLDPKRLPLIHVAELASLAGSLLEHSAEAEVRLKDGILKIQGSVPNDGIKSSLMELAKQVEAKSIEESIQVTPPETFFVPATLALTRNRFGITVSGVVQSEEVRAAIEKMLAQESSGARITNRIELDKERTKAPWQLHLATVLPILVSEFLGEMTVEFGEKQIRLSGEVAKEERKTAVLASLNPVRAAAEGLEILSDIRIRGTAEGAGPAVRLLVVYEPGLLSLTGNVPDDSFVGSLERTFESQGMDVLVKNSLEVTPSSPGDGWADRLEDLLEEIPGRVENAVMKLADGVLKMEGITIELADRQLLQNVAFNAVPSGYSVENLLIHADQPFPMPELLPEARVQMDAELANIPVYFDTGSEILDEEGKKSVESIFTLLKEGGAQVDLVVTGFADNVGNADSNRELSIRRAEAVVEVLVVEGIDESRVETKSVIEDVSRVRRSDRWKSRRVEVSLAPEDEPVSE